MPYVQWGENYYTWGEVEAHVGFRTAELRRAIQTMTALLQEYEWAEHVSSDPDITALECEITQLVGRANACLSNEFADALRRFERSAKRMGELWERCQGKPRGWPDEESAEFIKLRDETMPAIRAEIRAASGVSPANQVTDPRCI